jgi:hypothetical protein
MNNPNAKLIVIACVALGATLAVGEEIPKGWFRAGSRPNDYEMSVDRSVFHSGKASACLKSIVSEAPGFGTLMQEFKADAFRGKRIRLSGYVRSKDVTGWAGLWMRVDGSQKEMLAFDNMQNRSIKGTTDWTRYEIVLDVPDQAQEIAFGLLLDGQGQAWMDDLKFEAVGKDVPTTGEKLPEKVLTAPTNLNFED